MSSQIISLCEQNEGLTVNSRNTIVHEIDLIIDDLREVLSTVMNNRVIDSQYEFIQEFAMLVKNLFDSEIHTNLSLSYLQ